MDYMTFGAHQTRDRKPLYDLITKTKPFDGYSAELVNREYYETHYGIFDHDAPGLDKTRPLALIAHTKVEDSYSYSLLRRYMWRYRHHEIQKNWGLSLTQFMDLPWAMSNDLFTIEQQMAAIREQQEKDAERARIAALEAEAAGKK